MHRLFLPIDTKSLYLNIYNDNLKGHTCTVATPIVQGNSRNQALEQVYKIPNQINFQAYLDLIIQLISNSKSMVKINNVFVFDKIKVNGERISSDAKFCFFTKEEVDPQRIQFGRIKLHYPTSLKYDDLEIDNRKVLQSVSEALHDYAFVVNGFEYDFDDNSLNFICTIVGYNGIPYSRVFINTKGTGSKFSKVSFGDDDSYDLEIVALKKLYGDEANIDSYAEKMEKGRERALDLVAKYLERKGASQITIVSEEFPYSVFDFQYNLNGITHYCLVKATFTNLDYLDLTAEQYRFVNIFKTASIAFVKNIYSSNQIQIFHSNDLDCFRNNIRRLRLIRGGE